MAQPHDRPGVTWGPSPWLIALLIAGVGAAVALWWAWQPTPSTSMPLTSATAHLPLPETRPVQLAVVARSPTAATAPTVAPAPRIPRLRDPNGDQTPDLSDYVNEGERPSMAEVISRLHAAGVRTGLGAFNPPGTRPPLIGLAVPADFALPPGYVRHHQATDDGQRIEAVLMFAPGFQLVDAHGRPVAMPADRVVPPELAPPGLTLRRITVPAPLDASKPGS